MAVEDIEAPAFVLWAGPNDADRLVSLPQLLAHLGRTRRQPLIPAWKAVRALLQGDDAPFLYCCRPGDFATPLVDGMGFELRVRRVRSRVEPEFVPGGRPVLTPIEWIERMIVAGQPIERDSPLHQLAILASDALRLFGVGGEAAQPAPASAVPAALVPSAAAVDTTDDVERLIGLPRAKWRDARGHWAEEVLDRVNVLHSTSGGNYSLERLAKMLGIKRATVDEALKRQSARRDRATKAGEVERRQA